MARGLQCPACGHKHRLSSLPDVSTFSCEGCGRMLKVPDAYVMAPPSGEVPATSAALGAGGAVAAPPRAAAPRAAAPPRTTERPVERTAVLPSAGAAAAAASAPAAPPAGAPPAAAPRPRRPSPGAPRPVRVPRYLRIIAWLVAFPLGGVLALKISGRIGWVNGTDIIDMVTGEGTMRYVRVFLFVPFWALVTTALVTLFIDGGAWLMTRRRAAEIRRRSAAVPPRPRPPASSTPPAGTDAAAASSPPVRRNIPRRDG